MGIFDWLFGQKEIMPEATPKETPWALPVLMDWLFSGFKQREDGQWVLQDMPKFPGNLSPDINETMFPQVQEMWKQAQNSPAMQYLTQAMQPQEPFKLSDQINAGLNMNMQQGGMGGAPTQNMFDITQYGGVPGAPLEAIKAMMQYGAPPGPASQYMSNVAQFGIPSEAGRALYNRAYGGPTAAQQFLQAYAPGTPQPPKKGK